MLVPSGRRAILSILLMSRGNLARFVGSHAGTVASFASTFRPAAQLHLQLKLQLQSHEKAYNVSAQIVV